MGCFEPVNVAAERCTPEFSVHRGSICAVFQRGLWFTLNGMHCLWVSSFITHIQANNFLNQCILATYRVRGNDVLNVRTTMVLGMRWLVHLCGGKDSK